MFASKGAILVSFFALSSSVLATPPACLLAAVNQQQNPADLSSVCGSNGHQVQQAIASICGSNVAVAESAFAATCSSAGHKVASYTVSSTPTNTANGTFVYTTQSYDSACSCTKTYVTSATSAAVPSGFGMTASSAQATGSASSTATGSAGANATGAAAPGAQQAVGSLAAAVVAVAGLVAWL